MARAFPKSEDDVSSRAGAIGWQLTRYAPKNLTIEHVVIDATTIVLDRGPQHAFGWLVASCRDDDGVERTVRPQADWLPASRRISESKLWLRVTDGDRAAAELLTIAPVVERGLDACVEHFRAWGWVIAKEDVVDNTYDNCWHIKASFPSHQLHLEFYVGFEGGLSPNDSAGKPEHFSSGGTRLWTRFGNLHATIYSGPLAEELADALVQPSSSRAP